MYKVLIDKRVRKDIDKIPKVFAKKIIVAIEDLANSPRPSGCKKLIDFDDLYRIRVGKYRIIYSIEDEVLTVIVIKIGHRQSIYE